ncbi:sensor histidine kinase [Streptomyces sp. NRRL WC-3626]|uniref:sensor histidine kinase n=1 Tax=Streptomyces sp. NRRL WC-3626 TaxID=1463926 RepID=UPI0004BF7337|nr:ATP-binding protein [Streptomyces sp. NRRL WC-3626]
MTSPLLPGDRPTPRSLLPVPLLTAAVSAAGVLAALLLVPDAAIGSVIVVGAAAAVLLCAAAATAAYAVLSARAARARLESVTQDVGRLLQERSRLTEESRRQHERLTGELTRERARLSTELDRERAHLAEALAAERDRLNEEHVSAIARLTQEHADECARLTDAHTAELTRAAERHAEELRRVLAQHADDAARLTLQHTAEHDRLEDERARLAQEEARLGAENTRLTVRLREADSARAAALAATANAAGRMQALSTGMLADLRAMEEKHHDEEVLADLLHLDHRTAQAGRLADSVAVLTGARSGRRWARPIAMESILRGAMGRISGYQRVRVHSASDTAVAGHAAEGVMHALAELLDNAANFSPPSAEVHVYVEEVPAGVIVSVEDSGLVMGEAQLRRAERAVSGESAELGGLTGTRLGLGVVGRLARRYGLRVSYRPSARGGTGVLMLVPQDILVTPDAPTPSPSPASAGMPSVPASPAALVEAEAAAALPRRGDDGRTETGRTRTGRPEPETGHVTARGDAGQAPADGVTCPGSALSYAASRAGADLDPDPVPTHESAGRDSDAPPLVLPRRSRGRTLAEAERTRPSGRTGTPRPAPTAEETKARTARFSSFRQAVRPPTPDDTADPDSGTTPEPTPETQPTPTTPEGDTTS